jgi:hypothetical protein
MSLERGIKRVRQSWILPYSQNGLSISLYLSR